MATEKKFARLANKRSASGSPIVAEQNDEQVLQCIGDLADDHDFLAPYEICLNAIGLLFHLITKRLTGISFSNLFHRSRKRGWMDLFTRERRNLKPNVNSLEKCFMLNRLISAYAKNPVEFNQQTIQLYEEIEVYMTCTTIARSIVYAEIQAYRNLQYLRRLFHINHEETKQPQTLLTLQEAATKLCSQLIDSCKTDVSYLHTEGQSQFKKLFQHAFIIVLQPSTVECVAGTKYEKFGNTYAAKLNSRILCLLEVDKIDAHFTLSPIAVTLYSLDRQLDEEGEPQPVLEWKTRSIVDAKGLPRSFYYAEVQSIKLTKTDLRSSRPYYSSKLCQLQFQLKIRMKTVNIEEDLTFLSRPFGLCSHAQYFPDYIAKILLYEIEQKAQIIDSIIQPNIVTEFICRYHSRITGVEPKSHTKEFIFQELQAVYEAKKMHKHFTSADIYEGILSKLINQIEFFVDHPYLSMMYHDNLFLGICNNQIDHQMNGAPNQLHILLRFNALAEHQSSQQASIRFIVHDGQLIKATFHTKAFVDEMCQMICESNSKEAKTVRILSEIPNRSFYDFSLYFDNDLFRLSTISPSTKEAYKPLIPVLWSTMRSPKENRSKQMPINRSPIASSVILDEKITLQTDKFIHYLVEKLPEIVLKLQISASHSTEECTEQKQLIVSNLLRDYLQTISQVQPSTTEMIEKQNNTKSCSFFCSALVDT